MMSHQEEAVTRNYRPYHNPKSYSPSVFIPCWLIQIPHSKLSYNAKLLYGRLAQWSNTKGSVHRSSSQLAEEIGSSTRTIERSIKELKEVGLIGTYQKERGGVNNFHFFDHEWMKEPLNSNLNYTQDISCIPSANPVGPPPPTLSDPSANSGGPKIEKIKRNKKNIYSDSDESQINKSSAKKEKEDKDKALFDKFYSAYPKKVAPAFAFKCFLKHKPTEEFTEMLIEDIKTRTAVDVGWRDVQYIPHPSTYLNKKYWQGEVVKAVKKDSYMETKNKDDVKLQRERSKAEIEKQILEREKRAEEQKKHDSISAKKFFESILGNKYSN